MALRLEEKVALVAEVNEAAASAHSALAAEYRGLTVAEMTELRKQARDQGVYVRVVKNTLARRAIVGTEFECMQEALEGPLVLAFSQEDPGSAARVFPSNNDLSVWLSKAVLGSTFPRFSERSELAT